MVTAAVIAHRVFTLQGNDDTKRIVAALLIFGFGILIFIGMKVRSRRPTN
jgi:hypothetical protein